MRKVNFIQEQNRKLIFLTYLSLVLLLGSCKSTKYVPKDGFLLKRVDVVVDNDKISKEDLTYRLQQRPNLKILGSFKFHLWLYNLSSEKKADGWFKRIGEPPVIYDAELEQKSKQQMLQYLRNKGYYNAAINDSLFYKNQKATLVYSIHSGEPYRINNIAYNIKDKELQPTILAEKSSSLLRVGENFDVDKISDESDRIASNLISNGYYRFSRDYIYYLVDTTNRTKGVNIEMVVENPKKIDSTAEVSKHRKYKINAINFLIKKGMILNVDGKSDELLDSIIIGNYTFYFNGDLPIKHKILLNSIKFKSGDLYNEKKVETSYDNLYGLRQFKYINIKFREVESSDADYGVLDCDIHLQMQTTQSHSEDIEGTNNSGDFGVAGNINYQHNNLFKGAENFDIRLKGARERQSSLINSNGTKFNTSEFGIETKLLVPWFLLPVKKEKLAMNSIPKTQFSLVYNYQNRPDYTRTIANASYGYQWKSSPNFTNYLNIIDLNLVRVFKFDSTFISSIKDLFIKSSYTSHIISASSYSFVFNKQNSSFLNTNHLLKYNIETAGNILSGVSSLMNNSKTKEVDSNTGDLISSYYKIFDIRYAQYVKSDLEYRFGFRLDKYNAFAGRVFLGAGLPYGNFHVMPFEKRYFTGGANGIRAWQVRSLGPGSYRPNANDEFPNQSADIKIEGNLDYRFKLFWVLEGALFLDAGNIWAINSTDNREGAVFKFDRFYTEFAVGTGVGLRTVSKYFIIRGDLGLKLRDPSLPESQRWIPSTRRFTKSDLNFSFAIGYPF